MLKDIIIKKDGFTMIELLVSLSVFSIIVAIVSGIFVASLRSNRTAIALITANNDASLTLDQMSRMIMKGEGSSFGTESVLSNPADPNSVTYKCLHFQYKGNYITYRWNVANKTLEWNSRSAGYVSCNTALTDAFSGIVSENLRVEYANFMIDKGAGGKYALYPKITILLRVGTRGTQISENKVPFNNLQMTISPRNDFRD
jgi:prepilin-type N-terminal cleavage/methylation domain-containing protein